MNPQYNVMLTGTLADGADRQQVLAALSARFGLALEKAEGLLAGKPVVVKRGVDEATAQRLCAQLQQMGVLSAAHPIVAPAPAPAAVVAAPAPVSAPMPVPPPLPPRASASLATAVPAPVVRILPPPPPLPAQLDLQQPGLSFKIEGQPDFAFLTVQIPAGETLKVEASAMATMDTHVSMKTKLGGGFGRFLTGESLFVNEFTADGAAGEIGIAPGAPGDLRHLYLRGQTVYLQNSGYVASTAGVTVESKWQGLAKGFFSGESLFLIRCQGTGDLWFASYGGIIEIEVDGDYVVDTGNIVAFTDGLDYRITKVGGYKSLFFSGEGLVCRFSGRGKVWIQTRKVGALIAWAHPFRRVVKRG